MSDVGIVTCRECHSLPCGHIIEALLAGEDAKAELTRLSAKIKEARAMVQKNADCVGWTETNDLLAILGREES